MEKEYQVELPKAFLEKMERLLKEEYQDFLKSYEETPKQGLRINPLKKLSDSQILRLKERFRLESIPWAEGGYYYDAQTRPGKSPFHEAGVYYIQEPSAMAVVELLKPVGGERILDLCAAPGGKTTQIAGKMGQTGLLVSNEIHPLRAKILSQNVERMGIANGVVTNESSQRLLKSFPEFFDGIVVDAPCSGEGMFRKEEAAREQWSLNQVSVCAARQKEILDNAAGMLKMGGRLVYSTCTFSPEENEGTIQTFLDSHPEFVLEKTQSIPGFSCFGQGRPEWVADGKSQLSHTVRIWPHRTRGEGHFLALLRKEEGSLKEKRKKAFQAPRLLPEVLKVWEEFAASVCHPFFQEEFHNASGRFLMFGEELYVCPNQMIDMKGLKVLRPGLDLGTFKKKRFEPSHSLALYLKQNQVKQWVSLPEEGEAVFRYLKGEALDLSGIASNAKCQISENGWALVLVEDASLGFAKLTGTVLKNHYPKGLRRS